MLHKIQLFNSIMQRFQNGVALLDLKNDYLEAIDVESPQQMNEILAFMREENYSVNDYLVFCRLYLLVYSDLKKYDNIFEGLLEKGHPLALFREENFLIRNFLENDFYPNSIHYLESGDTQLLLKSFQMIHQIPVHYRKRREFISPILEAIDYGILSEVLWNQDELITGLIHENYYKLKYNQIVKEDLISIYTHCSALASFELFVLSSLLYENLNNLDWSVIGPALVHSKTEFFSESNMEIIHETNEWLSKHPHNENSYIEEKKDLQFPTGNLTLEQLDQILNHLPFGITFVNAQNDINYFNVPKTFTNVRNVTSVGRNMKYCFPPSIVSRFIDKIDAFKNGELTEFLTQYNIDETIQLNHYQPVYDKEDNYIGFTEIVRQLDPNNLDESSKDLLSKAKDI